MAYSENPYTYYMQHGGREYKRRGKFNTATERIVYAMNVLATPSKKPSSLEPRELRDQLSKVKQIFPTPIVIPINTPNVPFGP